MRQRHEICTDAIQIAHAAEYQGAGTVEFLMDADTGAFFFIEVNPRIQVEHTVTEEVTGVDIVKAQIRIAEGAAIGDQEPGCVPARPTFSSMAMPCSAASQPKIRSRISSRTMAASPPIAAPPASAFGLTAAPPIPAR